MDISSPIVLINLIADVAGLALVPLGAVVDAAAVTLGVRRRLAVASLGLKAVTVLAALTSWGPFPQLLRLAIGDTALIVVVVFDAVVLREAARDRRRRVAVAAWVSVAVLATATVAALAWLGTWRALP